MKKFVIVAFTILVLTLVGIVVADSYRMEDENHKTKVGMILNGVKDDKSWGQSHFEGMERTKTELDLEVVYREEVPATEECIKVMEELITEGCEIIICNSYGYGEFELEVARKHPKVRFFHASGIETSENLSTYFGRIYQMRYLCGIVAGMQTETDEIGYVAAFPIAEVNRGINAFTLGVRSVNPDARVYVEWCNSWTGEKESREATERLLASHQIDVLTIHTDTVLPLDIAKEKNIWSIGYNLDNFENYPENFLTAAVWNWEHFYTPRIREHKQGRFVSNNYWEGAVTGIVDIAPLSKNVKAGIAEVVEQEKAKLESGTYDVFYGPIKDSTGTIRIQDGESMPDSELLNEFDWYVEGVVMDEESP